MSYPFSTKESTGAPTRDVSSHVLLYAIWRGWGPTMEVPLSSDENLLIGGLETLQDKECLDSMASNLANYLLCESIAIDQIDKNNGFRFFSRKETLDLPIGFGLCQSAETLEVIINVLKNRNISTASLKKLGYRHGDPENAGLMSSQRRIFEALTNALKVDNVGATLMFNMDQARRRWRITPNGLASLLKATASPNLTGNTSFRSVASLGQNVDLKAQLGSDVIHTISNLAKVLRKHRTKIALRGSSPLNLLASRTALIKMAVDSEFVPKCHVMLPSREEYKMAMENIAQVAERESRKPYVVPSNFSGPSIRLCVERLHRTASLLACQAGSKKILTK